jgi:hypothetical protein
MCRNTAASRKMSAQSVTAHNPIDIDPQKFRNDTDVATLLGKVIE